MKFFHEVYISIHETVSCVLASPAQCRYVVLLSASYVSVAVARVSTKPE
jgi:hypothetical protein